MTALELRLVWLASICLGCSQTPRPATTALEPVLTGKQAPAARAPAAVPSPARPLLAEVRGAGVSVAGTAVAGDTLSVRGALARNRHGADTLIVQLHDPTPELVEHLLRAALGTELRRAVLTEGEQTLELDLRPAAEADYILEVDTNGKLQLRSAREPKRSDDIATWQQMQPGDEDTIVAKLRELCAAGPCAVNLLLPTPPAAALWPVLSSWRRAAPSMPNARLGLATANAGSKTASASRLPPEVIQRVVRQSFGSIRGCFEKGLARDAKLEGKVMVRFVIARDGTVSQSGDAGSNLPDIQVRDCVIAHFRTLIFPPPEGGIVTVVYPILLAPE